MSEARDEAWGAIERVLDANEVRNHLSIADQILDAIEDQDLLIVESNAKKLLPADVRQIRAMHKRGSSQVDIAYAFRINPATVSRIVRGHYH